MSRRIKLLTLTLVVLLLGLTPGFLWAQELGSISGTVTDDSTGLPLANAVVVAHKMGSMFANKAFTDPSGNYTIPELPVGNYRVGACREGYQCEFYDNTQKPESATVVQVNAGQNTPHINFALTPKAAPPGLGSLSGNVIDDTTFAPLPGVYVTAISASNHMPAGHAVTGENGNYKIMELEEGDYYVFACKEGYICEFYDNAPNKENATLVHVTAGQDTPNINFALLPKLEPPFGSISGTVTDFDTGEPIACAIVVAIDVEHHLEYHSKAKTDSSGNYTIANLFPGKYKVLAWAFGYEFAVYPETVTVAPGEDVVGINFQLKKKQTGAIAGNVTEKGSGTPLKALVLAHQIEGRGFGQALTDETGHYLIENLPEGKYKVIAFAKEHHPAVYPEPVPVIGGQITDGINLELELLPLELTGVISGTVTDESTSVPLPQALIVAFAKTEEHHLVRFTFSKEDGTYELTHLPHIPFYVACWAKGYMAELYNNVHRLEDATLVTPDASGIDFALTSKTEHPLVVSGATILAANNSPLAGVLVNAFERTGGIASAAFSLPDGYFYLEGLSFENYDLGVASTHGNTGVYSVDLSYGDNYQASLNLAAALRGDLNGDSKVNLTDIMVMVNALFRSMNPPPLQIGDVNCDTKVNLGDIIYLVNFVFKTGTPPCNP
ncbi:MAG: hypothetical protein A2145_01855 [candidate division Zixibacteria bacterium RBG_16_40_9]|nr:MAG: hypothetical protein A2145_01855 [candidate division Zixibacteria bacterium RBG_16_40_9]